MVGRQWKKGVAVCPASVLWGIAEVVVGVGTKEGRKEGRRKSDVLGMTRVCCGMFGLPFSLFVFRSWADEVLIF